MKINRAIANVAKKGISILMHQKNQNANADSFCSTDILENYSDNKIVINDSFLSEGEYFKANNKKSWIFLHYTASHANPYRVISSWENDKRGRIATEFVIGGQHVSGGDSPHDGEVVRAFPSGSYAWHLGIGNTQMHRESIGLELCSMGYLTKGGYFKSEVNKEGKTVRRFIALGEHKFYSYTGAEAHPSQVLKLDKPHLGHLFWHKFSDAQIESTRKLLIKLHSEEGISLNKGLLPLIIQHGAKAFSIFDVKKAVSEGGLWSHSNVNRQKVDVFPQPELIEMIKSLEQYA